MTITTIPRNAPLTVVAFSGIAPLNHVFEWVSALEHLPVNVVGVQDPHDAWWQVGGDKRLRQVRSAIEDMGPLDWIALGGSAGGFGAILFGFMLAARRVVTFVPQTACGEAKRALGDLRWREQCEQTPSADLAAWGAGCEVHIGDDPLDVIHAERLRGARVVRHHGYGHDLPHGLKRDGLLDGILETAVTDALASGANKAA